MKKFILLSAILCAVLVQHAQAQFVTIPDANFRNALKQQFPNCFNAANQLDTVCAGNAADTVLDVDNKSISNLAGVRYFKNLAILKCGGNNLSTLPKLPPNLTYFDCSFNVIASIPALPSNIKILIFNSNELSLFPVIPNGVKRLYCGGNQFHTLPALPNTLEYLNCNDNMLDSITSFPPLLRVVLLNNSTIYPYSLRRLPTLPITIDTISCHVNTISSLPPLPNSLKYLNFSGNEVSVLPTLPTNLKHLDCSYNKLTSLPILPNNLKILVCGGNELEYLPPLPNNLIALDCGEGFLTTLPPLPKSLMYLSCGDNNIENLPALPKNLEQLFCGGNNISSLPALPNKLEDLLCGANPLNRLPKLPLSLKWLSCDFTPISCLPYLPNNLLHLNILSSNISCLPNKPELLHTIPATPVCNSNNNSNVCDIYPIVQGYVYKDLNNNGIKESNEIGLEGVKVSFNSRNLHGITNNMGFYEITLDTLGTEFLNIGSVKYHSSTISSAPITLTQSGDSAFFSFPVIPQGNIKDFKVSVNNFTAFARPGFPLHFRIKYENIGTIAGNATVKFAHAALYNVDSTSITNSFSSDTLVWNFSNVPAGFTGYINVYGRLSATAVLGSTQNFYASVNQNDIEDNVLADNRSNLALVVRGSYDPNDKQGTRTLTPTQVANGQFIDYTIRFQNTGTDTAFTVVIADTLANNLQANTLEMIATSHNSRTSVKDNKVYFEFLNILLPDSNVNEPRSHGFVKFRVKPKNTLVLGNTIQNKAAIYFDYNAPIITNTVVTTVAIPTGIAEKISNRLEVYPNPLEGEMLTIPNMRGASAKLLTLTGQELRSWTNIAEQISLQNIAAGMYLLEISQNGQRRAAKVVVK